MLDEDWSPARIETVKTLWVQGLSASLIGERMGKTRNSILAKVNRLRALRELPERTAPIIRANRAERSRRQPGGASPQTKQGHTPQLIAKLSPSPSTEERDSPIVEVIVPMKERRGVEDLKPTQCRWPMGDPQSQGFHFCHHKREEGPYCAQHRRIAFVPSTYSGAGGR